MIVIPMAGASRRFFEAGYTSPKYMLPLAGRPIFDWAVASFTRYFDLETFLFVIRDIDGTRDFVAARAAALGIRKIELVTLDHVTAGQAETVEFGLDCANVAAEESLAIFNIDTIRPNADIEPQSGKDGWLEVFEADGDHWSFILPDPNDPTSVLRTTEKVRISDHCCTGLYTFRSRRLFDLALKEERAHPSSRELFVAPIYNHLIARQFKFGWKSVSGKDVLQSGTPAEYEALLAAPPSNLPDLGTSPTV